jgi:hypothetical protein
MRLFVLNSPQEGIRVIIDTVDVKLVKSQVSYA